MEEVKEPVDTGPRPWNEPKIPMQQTKTGRQQFEEAIGNIKVKKPFDIRLHENEAKSNQF